jgi:hypothetical protein
VARPTIGESIQRFLDEIAVDAVEERVVGYVIREVRNGRKLAEALKDPEVISALEAEIVNAFEKQDFGFTE